MFFDRLAAILKEQVENLRLLHLLSILGWSRTLLVLHLEVSALVDQELDHFKAIVVDTIVYRPLILCILVIEACAQVNELLYGAYMPLSYCVVDAGLAILILPID